MIIQPQPDGSLIMIAQSDHSLVSGVFAAHWGNGAFQRPEPFEPVVRAAMLHDCGWYRYEASPRFDDASGTTPAFMHVALDAEQLGAFQWGSDWVADIDPYAGMLVNRHRTGLWRGRYGAIAHPQAFNARNLSETVEAFIARNEKRHEQQLASVDQHQFVVNYRLLQVWDLLSLYFCVAQPKDDHIEPVPRSYDATDTTRLTLAPLGGGKVAIDPYPFGVVTLPVHVVHRHLPIAKFKDRAAFRQAYYQAVPEVLRFELVPK